MVGESGVHAQDARVAGVIPAVVLKVTLSLLVLSSWLHPTGMHFDPQAAVSMEHITDQRQWVANQGAAFGLCREIGAVGLCTF